MDTSSGTQGESTNTVSESSQENDAATPTIIGLGMEHGNYIDEDKGVAILVRNKDWNNEWSGDADKSSVRCRFTMYNAEFGVNIFYPEKIYDVHFGDGLHYRYDPVKKEVSEFWFDVDAELKKITEKNAEEFNEEIIKFIDDLCIDTLGYTPDELITFDYE